MTSPLKSAAASVVPSGLIAAVTTVLEGSHRAARSTPVVISQSRTTGLARSPTTSSEPSGENDKATRVLFGPLITNRSRPVGKSQIRIQ